MIPLSENEAAALEGPKLLRTETPVTERGLGL